MEPEHETDPNAPVPGTTIEAFENLKQALRELGQVVLETALGRWIKELVDKYLKDRPR